MKEEVILNFDLYKKYKSEYAPDSFHHVAFKTQNYDAMVEFYEKLFGCKPMYKSNDIAFLAFDELFGLTDKSITVSTLLVIWHLIDAQSLESFAYGGCDSIRLFAIAAGD